MPAIIQISNKKNFIIKVFVIGYSQKGESIIILFIDEQDNNILYTIVIDCFLYKKINKTKEILEEYNISNIDMLCWSHPDDDHTKGIDSIIRNFCTENTKIILPQGVNGKDYDMISYNKNDKILVSQILRLNEKKKKIQLTASVATALYHPMDIIEFSDYPEKINLNIHALSPHSALINERIGNEKKIDKNELSIALHIKVDEYQFVFCSDIENPTIDNIMTSCFDNPILIKIPHHTSPTSDRLLDIIKTDQNNTLGCTTIYKQHNLPNTELLERYKNICSQIHTTGTSKGKNKNYGVIEYNFHLYSEEKKVEIACYGHAKQV